MPDELRAALESALGSQYAIQRLLGRGGMGAVYLATDRSLERPVAIKVLAPEISAAVENTERFRREARIAARLGHPNIVPLYAFGEADGLWYYVMGYVRGGSLAERLGFEGKLPCHAVRRIIAELGDALDYAHRQGVVHRDIKPANVLIDADSGRPMLADFGIARTIDNLERLTATGLVVGTPHYMSPEQASGAARIDGRADIYSLGVLAYAMLVGHEPFDGASPYQVAVLNATRAAPRLTDLDPEIPPDLAAVVERCLAKDPDARWPDGRSLRRAVGYDEAEDTATPAELRDIPSFGTLAAVWGIAWAGLAVANSESPAQASLCVLLAALVPLGLLLDVWSINRRGLLTRDIIRVAFWPPMWWGLWWPRALRRRGDLWDRLPLIARMARIAITGFLFGAPLLLLLAHVSLPAPLAALRDANPSWFAASAGILIAILLGVLSAVFWWGRTHGLSALDMVRLVHGPTILSASWAAPQIAQMLTPPRARDGEPPAPETPQGLRRAIEELAESLSDGARPLGRAAAAGAGRLVGQIEVLDAELAALGRDAEPAEVARLEAKLGAMGGGATDAGAQRQMREVLVRQLELMRRMRAQAELAAGRRGHLLGLLQRLWARLAERASASTSCAPNVEQLDDRLRAVCAEVDAQADSAPTPSAARDAGEPARSE